MTGVSVMNRRWVGASLNGCVAMGAQRNKVRQVVGAPPVAAEVAPRLNVVHVHWAAYFGLGSAATLAGVVVTLASLVLLGDPSGAAPFLIAALPVAMILALLPLSRALVGAKPPGVFAACHDVAAHGYGFPAHGAGEGRVPAFGLALAATKARPHVGESVRVYIERFAAMIAVDVNALFAPLIVAFGRAKFAAFCLSGAAVIRLAAVLTGEIGVVAHRRIPQRKG